MQMYLTENQEYNYIQRKFMTITILSRQASLIWSEIGTPI